MQKTTSPLHQRQPLISLPQASHPQASHPQAPADTLTRPSTPDTLGVHPDSYFKDVSDDLAPPGSGKIFLFHPMQAPRDTEPYLLVIAPIPFQTKIDNPTANTVAVEHYDQTRNELRILKFLHQFEDSRQHLPPIPVLAESHQWIWDITKTYPTNFVKKQAMAGKMDLFQYINKYAYFPFFKTENSLACLLERTKILQQYLPALVGFHAHGLAHKDIKSENMTLNEPNATTSSFKFIDFGLAKLVSDFDFTDNAGSLKTKDPELSKYQHLKPDEAVAAVKSSDIYSFACVCYEVFFYENYHEILEYGDFYDFSKVTGYDQAQYLKELYPFCPTLHTTLLGMLDLDWRKRPSAEEVLQNFNQAVAVLEFCLEIDY